MNVQDYLGRISHPQKLDKSLSTLHSIQEAHIYSVPFENLDIHYGRSIDLDLPKIYDKIINRGRGGFCYELNYIFFWFLNEMGYQVDLVSAQVYFEGQFGKEHDHLALLVEIEGNEYLVDVGFGKFTLHPLKFELDLVQSDPFGDFRITSEDSIHYVVEHLQDEYFVPQYKFTRKARKIEEFTDMCTYHQSSPQSHFTSKRMISIATKTGRLSLIGNYLKITDRGNEKTKEFQHDEYDHYLLEYFDIVVNELK